MSQTHTEEHFGRCCNAYLCLTFTAVRAVFMVNRHLASFMVTLHVRSSQGWWRLRLCTFSSLTKQKKKPFFLLVPSAASRWHLFCLWFCLWWSNLRGLETVLVHFLAQGGAKDNVGQELTFFFFVPKFKNYLSKNSEFFFFFLLALLGYLPFNFCRKTFSKEKQQTKKVYNFEIKQF